MPQLVHIFERKTGKKHQCYPVDAVENLKIKENPTDPESKPMYVASEAECDKPAPAKADKPAPAKAK